MSLLGFSFLYMKWDDNGHFKIVLEFNSVSENVCVTTAIIAEVRSRALFHYEDTVKPVASDHGGYQAILVGSDRWSLVRGIIPS